MPTVLGLVGLLLCPSIPSWADDESLPRPLRLPASPRWFGRNLRPVDPRTDFSIQIGHTWGRAQRGVEEEQTAFVVAAEGAYRPLGLWVEAPVVIDLARTEGVYGPGKAMTRGAGDLGFGVDARLLRFSGLGLDWRWGAGLRVTAPTGGTRRVTPETPLVTAPWHELGPAAWTLRGGSALQVGPVRLGPAGGLSAQLDGELLGMFRDLPERPNTRNHWLFGCLALTLAWQPLAWLEPLLTTDLQLELYGASKLRQLVFLTPGLRLRPVPRLTLDLAARVGLGDETRREQELALGLSLSLGLGPEGDHAW